MIFFAELKPVKLEVIPAYGDPNGSHVTINVVSQAFEGKRAVQRQQMVYKVHDREHGTRRSDTVHVRSSGRRCREPFTLLIR